MKKKKLIKNLSFFITLYILEKEKKTNIQPADDSLTIYNSFTSCKR